MQDLKLLVLYCVLQVAWWQWPAPHWPRGAPQSHPGLPQDTAALCVCHISRRGEAEGVSLGNPQHLRWVTTTTPHRHHFMPSAGCFYCTASHLDAGATSWGGGGEAHTCCWCCISPWCQQPMFRPQTQSAIITQECWQLLMLLLLPASLP